MTNDTGASAVFTARSAADYAESERSQRLYARQEALRIAHDPTAPAKDVVARADAYIAFVLGA